MSDLAIVLIVGVLVGLIWEWRHAPRNRHQERQAQRNDALRLAAKIGSAGLKSDRVYVDRRTVPSLRRMK